MSKINWNKLPKDYTSTDLSNLLKESGVDPNNWIGSNQSIPELDMLSELEKNFIAAFEKADYPKLDIKPEDEEECLPIPPIKELELLDELEKRIEDAFWARKAIEAEKEGFLGPEESMKALQDLLKE